MGFLQQFFQNVFQQSPVYEGFAADLAEKALENLEIHLASDTIGEFHMTDAIRPSLKGILNPRQGYRHDVYRDEETGNTIPVIMAAASREILFSLFMQLVQKLGPSVDVVLESSHDHASNGHTDFYREQIDAPVLISALWDYEDLLTNDGCTGIAVLNPATPQEVQFDEHKMLIIYGSPLEQFEHVLEQNGVHCIDDMAFITEAEHIHMSSHQHFECFDRLRTQLGIDADFGSENFC